MKRSRTIGTNARASSLAGLREHDMPEEYCRYVRSRIIENNGELKDALPAFTPNAQPAVERTLP